MWPLLVGGSPKGVYDTCREWHFLKCVHDEPLNGGVTFRDPNLTRLAALLLLDSFVFIVCHSLNRRHGVRFLCLEAHFRVLDFRSHGRLPLYGAGPQSIQ